VDRIVTLRREGQSTQEIADTLKQEGFHPPKRRGHFHPLLIRKLLSRRGLTSKNFEPPLGANEWWLADLAVKVGIRTANLRIWVLRGWVHGRRTPSGKFWVAWADDSEIQRLQKLKAHSFHGCHGYPVTLTIPKQKADS
jgi:hypothetical protein